MRNKKQAIIVILAVCLLLNNAWSLEWPLNRTNTATSISSVFGEHRLSGNGHIHAGIDLNNTVGTNVYACESGIISQVIQATNETDCNGYIQIQSNTGLLLYYHIKDFCSIINQSIK